MLRCFPRQAKSAEATRHDQREAERDYLLKTLIARCQKMLELQIAVHHQTQRLCQNIVDSTDKKPRREDRLAALKLADREQAIVTELTKAIALLGRERSAIAFPEIFEEVRKDALQVQKRLARCDLGSDTQAIQTDIIETFREMVRALNKS